MKLGRTSKIINRLRKWRHDKHGGFSIQFAVMMVPLLATVGGTFDIAQSVSNKKKLQLIADGAALAAINGNHTDAERKQIFANYVKDAIDPSWGFKNIASTASITHEGNIVKVTGGVTAEAESVSLHLIGKKNEMSVDTQTTLGMSSVELVLTIDISSSMRGARIAEAKKSAKQFIETLLEKPELDGRINISIVPFGGTVRVPQMMDNLVTDQKMLTDVVMKSRWMDRSWNGCYELSQSDFVKDIKPTDKFDVMPDFYTWNKSNPWCPRKGTEFLPLTDSKTKLLQKIDMMQLSDGTGTDHGLAWSRVNLSADWQNKIPGGTSGLPMPKGEDVKKIIVLMTDGGVTGQHKVAANKMTGKPPFFTHRKQRYSNKEGYSSFDTLCNKIKLEDNTEIYTIGYLMRNAYQIGKLEACASAPDRHYVSSSGGLDTIFDDIAVSISLIRISH